MIKNSDVKSNLSVEDEQSNNIDEIDVRNKLDTDGWSTSDSALKYDSEYALVIWNQVIQIQEFK